eukprot:UN04167
MYNLKAIVVHAIIIIIIHKFTNVIIQDLDCLFCIFFKKSNYFLFAL